MVHHLDLGLGDRVAKVILASVFLLPHCGVVNQLQDRLRIIIIGKLWRANLVRVGVDCHGKRIQEILLFVADLGLRLLVALNLLSGAVLLDNVRD